MKWVTIALCLYPAVGIALFLLTSPTRLDEIDRQSLQEFHILNRDHNVPMPSKGTRQLLILLIYAFKWPKALLHFYRKR